MQDLHKLIKDGSFEFPTFDIGPPLSEESKDLIKGMIKVNIKERMTIPQILVHPWLKDLNSTSDQEEDEEDKD